MRQLKITKSITNRNSDSLEKYLHDIGKEELITPEEEVELAMWRFASMKPIQNFEGWLLQKDKIIVNMMCETFGVSKAALLIRLRHLGYLVDLPHSEYKEPWEVWA